MIFLNSWDYINLNGEEKKKVRMKERWWDWNRFNDNNKWMDSKKKKKLTIPANYFLELCNEKELKKEL